MLWIPLKSKPSSIPIRRSQERGMATSLAQTRLQVLVRIISLFRRFSHAIFLTVTCQYMPICCCPRSKRRVFAQPETLFGPSHRLFKETPNAIPCSSTSGDTDRPEPILSTPPSSSFSSPDPPRPPITASSTPAPCGTSHSPPPSSPSAPRPCRSSRPARPRRRSCPRTAGTPRPSSRSPGGS